MNDKPLVIDLFCGLFGWGEAFAQEGYDVIGFDIVDMCAALKRPKPDGCHLVLQDVRTIDGRLLRSLLPRLRCIVASPPCQEFASLGFPWHRLKSSNAPAIEQWEHEGGTYSDPYEPKRPDLSLFRACFRIAQEAGVPLILENVKNAQKYVGSAKWHFGSYYLWGDLPALMPQAAHRKVNGFNFHQHEKTGKPGGSFQSAAVATMNGVKVPGLNWSKGKAQGFNVTAAQRWREEHGSGVKCTGQKHGKEYAMTRGPADGIKQPGLSGPAWFDQGAASQYSHSDSRKAASAQIAKIPPDLAQWIARCFKQ